jgi:hypothetical protein
MNMLRIILLVLIVSLFASCTIPHHSHVFNMIEPQLIFENWQVDVFMGAGSKEWNYSEEEYLFYIRALLTIPHDVHTIDTMQLDGKTITPQGYKYRSSKYAASLDTLEIFIIDSSGSHSLQLGPLVHNNSTSEPWYVLSTKENVFISPDTKNLQAHVSVKFRELDNDSIFIKKYFFNMKRKDEFRLGPPDWLNH